METHPHLPLPLPLLPISAPLPTPTPIRRRPRKSGPIIDNNTAKEIAFRLFSYFDFVMRVRCRGNIVIIVFDDVGGV